ncbi:phage tail tip protein J-related protein [Proteus mirabilis]|uniref:phage tail tip protein J-related protein n=1 Tax=Proteus mirabilis TaxID=584 RepID=UPI0035253F44
MGKTVTSVVSAGLMIAGVIATGGLGTALIVAGIAVQAASAFIFKDKVPGSGYRDQSERKQMLRSASAPETVVVGKTMMSGLLFFAEEEEGEQDENEELYMALAIASHPIHKLGQIYFNDDKIEDLGDNAQYEFHNGRTEADPYLLKHAPSWKEDMIGRGLAWLRLTLRFDQEKFPYGVPNVKSELWGKEIYDPRTEKTAWSNNGALVILDYYRHYLGVPDSDIDWNAFKVAADICDETVQTPDGKSEPRYTLNGAYELEESPASVLEMMHKCIAGEPTYIAGKHGILMQVYNGPALLTIDESQIIDTVTVTPELSLRDATNAIYGTFVDAEQQYNKTDFEPVVIEEWIEEDGLEIKENMDYRFVTSPYQANRLANLYLRKKRAGRRIQLRMNLDGYAYRPGDVIKLELPSLGISDLEFRIADWKFHPSEGVEITLEEDGPYIYEDLASKPFVRPPFTKLPTGGVPAPINLAFAPLSVTDIVQGYISWQNVASDIRYNTVNILQNGKVIQSIQVPGERVDINGLTRGTYRVEVRAINVAGAMSAPAISDFAIQAPPAPIGVEITPGMFSLTASPRQGDSAVFGYTFEFWFSEKKLANLSENEVITKTNKVGQGNFWTQENLKAGHTYYFYIRTINSYGKSVFVEASGVPVSLPTDIFDDLDNTVRETEAFKQLSEELKWNTESIAVLTNATYSLSTDVLQRSANAQAGITQLQQLRVSDNEAWAQDIKRVYASIEDNDKALRAEIKETQTSITELNKAFGQTTTEIRTELKITNDATNKRIDSTNQKLGNTDKEVGRIRADVATNKEAISETNKAMAKSEEQVQAQFGKQQGMINQKMQAEFSQTGDGVVTHSINITIVHNNVKYNAAGQVISAQVKNGKLESFIGYNANNFAWYNPVNGKMELFMYAKNGRFFIRDLFIEDGSITNAKIGNVIQSNNYLNGRPSWIINKNGFAEFQNIKARGEIEATSGKLENVVIEESCDILGKLKVENLEGNIVTVTQDVYHNLSFSHSNIVELFKVKRRTQKCFIWVQGALNPYERIPNNGVKPENRSAFAYRAPMYRNGAGVADIYIDGVIQPRPGIYNMEDTATTDFYAVNEFVLELSPGEGIASVGIKIPQGGGEVTRFIMRARIIVFPDNQDVIFN